MYVRIITYYPEHTYSRQPTIHSILKGDKMKKIYTAIGLVAGILLLIYGTGVYYFSGHTYPNTRYGTVSAGNLNREQLKDALNANDSLEFTIKEGNNSSVISGEAVKYDRTYDDAYIRWNQDPWAWPVQIFGDNELPDIPYTATFDRELLKKEIENSSVYTSTDRTPSQDAKIAEGESYYVIQDEVYGNEIIPDKYVEAVEKAVADKKNEINISAEKPYIMPEITKDSPELQEELEVKNRWAGTDIKLNVDGEEIPFIDWRNKYGLETNETEGFAEYNDAKFWEIASELADKYNTVNTRRTFRNSLGQTIKLDPGTYGWAVDKDTLVQRLNETVAKGAETEVSVPFTGTARGPAGNDLGDSYIEIDLASQYLWLYKNGELALETPIVSGLLVEGRATPTGVFFVQDRVEGAVLSGATYVQPVDYWVEFTDEGHGLHDANWVGEFGGDRYTYAGSHGCINLPVPVAPEVYALSELGMPVIIYNSDYAEEVSAPSEGPSDEPSHEEVREETGSGSEETETPVPDEPQDEPSETGTDSE